MTLLEYISGKMARRHELSDAELRELLKLINEALRACFADKKAKNSGGANS